MSLNCLCGVQRCFDRSVNESSRTDTIAPRRRVIRGLNQAASALRDRVVFGFIHDFGRLRIDPAVGSCGGRDSTA